MGEGRGGALIVMKRNIAVVLAGGTGSRIGGAVPKQFFQVRGRMLIEYAVSAFEEHPQIDEIAIVSHTAHLQEVADIIRKNGWKKVAKLLPGGKERYDSSLSAIRAYTGDDDVNLIFHDAARPLVSRRIITDVVETLRTEQACGVALPTVDTIFVCNAEGYILSSPERATLQRAQTPQGFHLPVIREAYAIGLQDPAFRATDDCGIVLRYMPHIPIRTVPGEEQNLKVTYKDDLQLLQTYMH